MFVYFDIALLFVSNSMCFLYERLWSLWWIWITLVAIPAEHNGLTHCLALHYGIIILHQPSTSYIEYIMSHMILLASFCCIFCLYQYWPTAQLCNCCFAFDFGIVNVHKTIIWMVMDHSGHDSNLADEIWPAYIFHPLHNKAHWQYKIWQLPFKCWEVLVMAHSGHDQ